MQRGPRALSLSGQYGIGARSLVRMAGHARQWLGSLQSPAQALSTITATLSPLSRGSAGRATYHGAAPGSGDFGRTILQAAALPLSVSKSTYLQRAQRRRGG